MGSTHDYNVAVTFAGEDRQFVEDVVRRVVDVGYKVFFDQDEQILSPPACSAGQLAVV